MWHTCKSTVEQMLFFNPLDKGCGHYTKTSLRKKKVKCNIVSGGEMKIEHQPSEKCTTNPSTH